MDSGATLPTEEQVNKKVGDISLNDVRDAISCLLSQEFTHKLAFIALIACLLTGLTLHSGITQTPIFDVFMYSAVYSSWVTLCLPWLVKNMDGKNIGRVASVMLRLFGADIGVLTWKIIRGHTHVFHRGLRMRPLFEASMSWLSEAGYNLRWGVVTAAVIASVISVSVNVYRRIFTQNHRLSSRYSYTAVDYDDSLTSRADSSPILAPQARRSQLDDEDFSALRARSQTSRTIARKGTVEVGSQLVDFLMQTGDYDSGVNQPISVDRSNLMGGVRRAGKQVWIDPMYICETGITTRNLERPYMDPCIDSGAFNTRYSVKDMDTQLATTEDVFYLRPDLATDARPNVKLGDLKKPKHLTSSHHMEASVGPEFGYDFKATAHHDHAYSGLAFDCLTGSQIHGKEGFLTQRESTSQLQQMQSQSAKYSEFYAPVGGLGAEISQYTYTGDLCGDVGRVIKEPCTREAHRNSLQGALKCLQSIKKSVED